MNQEIEIEFKNLLTKKEFQDFLTYYKLKEKDFISQTNYYFDTENFALKDKQSALRIRYKNGVYILTLKEPHTKGILETHEELSEEETNQMLTNGGCINGMITERLSEMMIDTSTLHLLGSLTTNRAEVKQENALLVFDHSFYLEHEDFELEMEVSNRNQGEIYFKQLLEKFKIPTRETPNKMERFFKRNKALQ
ncbi:CYTH domain-containing protein [Bacillus solimangrovi]|uniref:CYTH domain-containing protein n=1 Tax=Bacillus solimangrovi TaxID=1305675 RepID=A0A1E5LBZ0_9BACI|nr:CYTH domain-containing protein [Bacillus solimangrovi]OEH91604.1 hypothetical protein BFG57_04325 [Bacillus solimangrovi]